MFRRSVPDQVLDSWLDAQPEGVYRRLGRVAQSVLEDPDNARLEDALATAGVEIPAAGREDLAQRLVRLRPVLGDTAIWQNATYHRIRVQSWE